LYGPLTSPVLHGAYRSVVHREQTTIFLLDSDQSQSPYVKYVLPLIDTVQAVKCAVASSAAYHIGSRTGDKNRERQGLVLRVKAIGALRDRLAVEEQSAGLGTLVATLMLAQLDVSKHRNDPRSEPMSNELKICSIHPTDFELHLEAARGIIELQGSGPTADAFFEQRLVWLDVMGASTSSRIVKTSAMALHQALNRFSGEARGWGADVFPCPIELFKVIAEGTMLYKSLSAPILLNHSIVDEALRLVDRALAWTPSETDDSSPRLHLEKAYRHSVLLYIAGLYQLMPDHVQDCHNRAEEILRHAKSVPAATAWSYSMSWPLFQAGLHLSAQSVNERAWLTQHFKSTLAENGCCQVSRALDVLHTAWQDKQGVPLSNSVVAGSLKRHLILV
jgi:hypothetical protein